jgi:hypothetical protein
MTTALALVTAAVNLLAGAWGAWRWWRVEPDRVFWLLLRSAQAVAVVFAIYAGVSWVLGDRDESGDLFELYALLPVAVAFFAEQLRLVSAQTVLDARGLADAQAVGGLPEAEQRSIVTAILRRELGIMAASALVVTFLALRAAATV